MKTNLILSGACGLLFALPVFAADSPKPTVGAEALVAPATGTNRAQCSPAAAFNGEVYLVAWQDGAGGLGNKECEIRAARLDKSGKTLDEKSILISKAEGQEMRKAPAVAACGKDFLVAWEDYRNGKDQDLYAARVTGEGKVLDPGGFAVSAKPGAQVRASAASDGKTGWLVTWSDFRSGDHYEVYAARVSPDGKVLEPDGLAIATGPGPKPSHWDSSVAWGGKSYTIVWMTGPAGVSCQVTPDGKVLGPLVRDVRGKYSGGQAFYKKPPEGIDYLGHGCQHPRLTAGSDGLLVTMQNVWGKDGMYNGPWYTQAALLDAGGKARIPENKDALPKVVGGDNLPNPGWIMEPVIGSGYGSSAPTPWYPCPAAMGKDWLVVLQKRTCRGPNPSASDPVGLFREDVVAARILADGSCPDRAGALVIDATEGYNKANPAVCSGPEGEVLVVYERQKAIGDYRIAARVIKKP